MIKHQTLLCRGVQTNTADCIPQSRALHGPDGPAWPVRARPGCIILKSYRADWAEKFLGRAGLG